MLRQRSRFRSRPLAQYDARFGEGAIAAAVRERIAQGGVARLLEIGCGEGRVLMELCSLFPTLEIHGINRAPWDAMRGDASLPETAEHYGIFTPEELAEVSLPSVRFYDAQELRFPSEHLDVVISQVSVPYVARKDLLLQEVWRTLKPGGVAFLHMDSSEPDGPAILQGDSPRFLLHDGQKRLAAADLFADAAGRGYDLRYRVARREDEDEDRDGQAMSHNLVMHKNTTAALDLGLAFDEKRSFDLPRLHKSPADWSWLWGYRSVLVWRR
jgi:SAM-dependent methyltransferase